MKRKNKIIIVVVATFMILSIPAINVINAEVFELKNQNKNNLKFKNQEKTDSKQSNIDELARMLLAAVLIPPSLIIAAAGLILSFIPTIFAHIVSAIKYILTEETSNLLIAICSLPFLISLIPFEMCWIVLNNVGKTTFFEALNIAFQKMNEEFQSIINDGNYKRCFK
jgi:hypothetical protein